MNEEGSRILLGDAEGLLHLVTLSMTDNRVDALCFIGLGSVSFVVEKLGELPSYTYFTFRSLRHHVWYI